MPQNTHLELISAEAERLPEPAREAANVQILRKKAAELACSVTLLPEMQSSATFRHRCGVLKSKLKPLFAALESSPPESPTSDDFRWLYENSRVRSEERRVGKECRARVEAVCEKIKIQ